MIREARKSSLIFHGINHISCHFFDHSCLLKWNVTASQGVTEIPVLLLRLQNRHTLSFFLLEGMKLNAVQKQNHMFSSSNSQILIEVTGNYRVTGHSRTVILLKPLKSSYLGMCAGVCVISLVYQPLLEARQRLYNWTISLSII